MRIRMAVPVALVLALGACGGGADPRPKATASPAAEKAMDGALPQVPDGVPVPGALTDFTCERMEEKWTASGAVSNTTKKPTSFQVTVHVGPADGQGTAARTKRISAVQPNGSVGFELDEIEARSPVGPCHVQVLAVG